jgi:hypothetical protein
MVRMQWLAGYEIFVDLVVLGLLRRFVTGKERMRNDERAGREDG